MKKVFLNLTNGLLYEDRFDGFIRIQSCHCERKVWDRVVSEMDNNFLMFLALGYDVVVVDYSARKNIPRSLYQGLEFVWFAVQKAWDIPVESAFVKNANCIDYFTEEYKKLSKHTIKKLKYYRKFVNDPKKPTVITGRTDKDGDYNFFTELSKNFQPESDFVLASDKGFDYYSQY